MSTGCGRGPDRRPGYLRGVSDGRTYELARVRLRDALETTVYVVRHPLETTSVRVIHFPEPSRLDLWCGSEGHPEAIVAGFFLREPWRPLGDLRLAGQAPSRQSPSPSRGRPGARACKSMTRCVSHAREELPADPVGDLVQAGPMLVSGGRSLVNGDDLEGFSAGSEQFDSDITDGRYPRCALGINDRELIAVACDGRRSGVDGGLTLDELARLLIAFDANEAINLDGGGSATLVHRGHLLNRPYSDQDQPAPESRPIVSALLFEERG